MRVTANDCCQSMRVVLLIRSSKVKYYANADIRMKQEAIEKATSDLNPILSTQIDFTFKDDEETLKKLYGLM